MAVVLVSLGKAYFFAESFHEHGIKNVSLNLIATSRFLRYFALYIAKSLFVSGSDELNHIEKRN